MYKWTHNLQVQRVRIARKTLRFPRPAASSRAFRNLGRTAAILVANSRLRNSKQRLVNSVALRTNFLCSPLGHGLGWEEVRVGVQIENGVADLDHSKF